MRLYEFEGKMLLNEAGVPVPRGRLIERSPGDGRLEWGSPPEPPVVLKAQVLQGRRGLRGAVRVVLPGQSVEEVLEHLSGLDLDGEPVRAVLAEECLDAERELYLSVRVDRRRRLPVWMASPSGGVAVEEHPEGVLDLPVDVLLDLRPHHVRALAGHLGLPPALLEPVVRGIWSVFRTQGCTLIEVNPLVLCRDGRLVAADAKVELDDRHPRPDPLRFPAAGRQRTPFEAAAADLNAVGVEMEGEVAVVGSGAGAVMATADAVERRGARIGAVLDIGGFPRTVEEQAHVFRTLGLARPRAVLFNFFTQVAPCDALAQAIASAAAGLDVPVFARLRGPRADQGAAILRDRGIPVTGSFAQACDWTAGATSSCVGSVTGVGD